MPTEARSLQESDKAQPTTDNGCQVLLTPFTPEKQKLKGYFWTMLPFFLAGVVLCAAVRVSSIAQVMGPLCEIDIVANTPLCASISKFTKELEDARWADFQTLVQVQNTIADTFVGKHPGGSELALKIAKAELATSDLVAAVRYSSLPSAEELAKELAAFVTDAGEAGDSLQDLDAKALGAIDR